ncbi:MAG: HAMP domain-containing protein [Gemmatimonadetes bacterium]|nr:MAG: HAMP domain-containing protein [Gemmatimonadota bacterium]
MRALGQSFRARVTLALFAFFVLSTLAVGGVTLRTLSSAAVRATAALAERVAAGAAGFYREEAGEMELLAERVGADLLEYRDGELRGGSVDHLVELGLYEAWIPFEVYRRLIGREALALVEPRRLGSWTYLMAFQRLPDGDVVATPVSLQAGSAALRGRDVIEIMGFVVVVGALVSFVLALLVGRTLTRPIDTLRVASERVGAGNLQVRLPAARTDEFEAVFSAFNRMVLRLRRARRQLVRQTRRTQAIVEESATAVVALDPSGVVTLVNPRARDLLGEAVRPGDPLGAEARAPEGFLSWVARCLAERRAEASEEFVFGDRRIHARARRISREGPGGLVLTLDDVTDELRTERILAWGEMARQVAHEVKNPLTPIKLGVQHIERAWRDGRPDFDVILARNARAILAEIERLDAIARSFSRFGAPAQAGAVPLEPVDVAGVVADVLDLYGGGEPAGVRFSADVPQDLPRVRARPGELKEVLLNLLENARAAVEPEGVVRIEAEVRPRASERAGADGATDAADAAADTLAVVELRVVDDGGGMPDEVLSRVFEPHFSTRSGGAGLGLAIVQRLVTSWGGTVSIDSGRGEGTVVRVGLMPWSEAGAGAGEADSSERDSAGGPHRGLGAVRDG